MVIGDRLGVVQGPHGVDINVLVSIGLDRRASRLRENESMMSGVAPWSGLFLFYTWHSSLNSLHKHQQSGLIEYDPIAHLNLLFSHPSTVPSVARVSSTIQRHKDGLSRSITALETAQAYGPDSSLERMQSAQAELASLFQRIESVRSRALQTERDITTMTADIKRLDGTKRNLTLSMTALKRLQMLTTAYEQLRGLSRTRQYRDYRSIEQIAVLSRNVSDLQRELLEQVCEDFEMAFAKGEVASRRGILVEACLVMDALGDHAKTRLVTWYVNTELREYRQVFRGNDEAGNLDNIGRRYAWFKRTLKTHEEEHAAIFPPHWRVGETLGMAFCDGTRDDFKGILEKSMRRIDGAKLDVNLLLSCLQETMDFEQSLEHFWHTNTNQLEESIKKRIDPDMASKVDLSSQSDSFMGVASAAVMSLVAKVELDCEGAWREMKNTNWSRMESVSDHSSYVGELLKHNLLSYHNTSTTAPPPQPAAPSTPLSPSFPPPPKTHPPAGFIKQVTQSMTRIDPLLKTLQVRPSPPESLVQAYLIHIGDRSDTNFRKILELKGVRKQDQPLLLELFAIHRESHHHPAAAAGALVQNSPLLTPLMAPGGSALSSSSVGGVGGGGIGGGGAGAGGGVGGPVSAGLQGRFDAASLGEKLLNAARDGVERMGTAPGAGGVGVGAQEKATINENLKNIVVVS
ncbi:hypothetical protein CHGG_01747 [Chaetomium globosum CBS 148.51]|uniref:Uncharacterized protein n=1 Tax=Chaetomium globosum (strain ATCC 6205 / CBS 148.51 / DSM 1962 / NBRC 6347 / NRRL 1970) TaxID=306901 RepID=Q2HDF7_CHAGB|nr:uncharacterized protein CHGG_01747 [Chaetomium globosum CBS 148.51]EAQ93512.1 hypothetical protein CHGG_01747 [Chaetomium globosum CBS 148.51]